MIISVSSAKCRGIKFLKGMIFRRSFRADFLHNSGVMKSKNDMKSSTDDILW